MKTVPITEFTRNFGVYREIAQREAIAVTSHGRATGYYISATEYEELQKIKSSMRRTRALVDLSAEEIEQILHTPMSAEHGHLDRLLKKE